MHPSVPDLEQLALDISRLDGERLCVVLDIIQSNEPTLTFDGELDLQALRAKTIAKLRKYLSKQMLGVTSLQANEASSSSYDEHRHAKQLIRLYKLSLKKCLSMRQSRREPDLRKR
ncbi:hypothetical protein AAVH_10243 [Aphelenchoides avenae]|nr:hypothetical protein AAVH_10243 [Aphelenchus avenae]